MRPERIPLFEFHRKFTDLQYIVSGDEEIDFIHIDDAVPEKAYDSESDAGFCRAAEDATVGRLWLHAGSFAVFEPQDAHSPGIKHKAENVRKIIFKIKVD